MAGWQDFTQLVQSFLAADLLESDLTGILNPSLTYLPTIEHNIGSLSVALEAQVAGTITVTVTDATGIVPTWSQRKTASAFGQVLSFTSPYAYTTASALNITVTSSVDQVVNCPTFIWGYGEATPGQQGTQLVRSDGRAYPLGSNVAFYNASVTGTMVPAPGAGLHILASSLWLSSTGFTTLTGIIGGASATWVAATSAPLIYGSIPPQGLLFDANTAITINQYGSAGITAQLIYDVVT